MTITKNEFYNLQIMTWHDVRCTGIYHFTDGDRYGTKRRIAAPKYHLPGSTGITLSFVLQDSDERFQNNLLPTTDLKPSSYPLNQFI